MRHVTVLRTELIFIRNDHALIIYEVSLITPNKNKKSDDFTLTV